MTTAAAVTPGGEDFRTLTDPFRAELLAYCYRMLGSVHEAEDQVQETLIRAWRSYGSFQGDASLRTWLYRIATNTCLRALETRSRRPLPSGLGGPGDDALIEPSAGRPEFPWLQPIPDSLFGAQPADPAAVVVSRQSMRLALIAALQYLPARQRAVLILRDVLGWRAAETAELVGTTTTAVNSVLQRARERLAQAAPAEDDIREPTDAARRELVDRYASAFENADVAALTALLREDATLEMPPQLAWLAGREPVTRFVARWVLSEPGRFRIVAAAANGQPALAAYLRDQDGVFRAHGIQVLTVSAAGIARIVAFNDPALFDSFALPPAIISGGSWPARPARPGWAIRG